MKIHTLTPSEAQFLGISPETVANYCVYEADPGDRWGSPWGGFMIAKAGWDGGGFLPCVPHMSLGKALSAWRSEQKPTV